MFPIDPETHDYDAALLERYDALAGAGLPAPVAELLPEVRVAGQPAGELNTEGAAFLDPTGMLRPGVPPCPPEGVHGTGMVATHACTPRTGHVSVGGEVLG